MLLCDHFVTFAGLLFQTLAVKNLNVSAHVTDQPGFLQSLGSEGDAFAAHAQHV